MDSTRVNRVEIIDHTKPAGKGRVYVFWRDGVQVTPVLQDDGRTLKIFIAERDG